MIQLADILCRPSPSSFLDLGICLSFLCLAADRQTAMRRPGDQAVFYFTLLTSLKIGVMIEIAMKPTTHPKKMINIGSIIDVKPLTVASTS